MRPIYLGSQQLFHKYLHFSVKSQKLCTSSHNTKSIITSTLKLFLLITKRSVDNLVQMLTISTGTIPTDVLTLYMIEKICSITCVCGVFNCAVLYEVISYNLVNVHTLHP